MKVKTSELTGMRLDWAVKTCENRTLHGIGLITLVKGGVWCDWENQRFSTDWAKAGPIIEREKINLSNGTTDRHGHIWCAWIHDVTVKDPIGPTPLIAAMRAYVASKLGDEVEIPEELKA